MKHKTCTIKWVSTYVRQRSAAEHDAYEYKKIEKLSTPKCRLLVMGVLCTQNPESSGQREA